LHPFISLLHKITMKKCFTFEICIFNVFNLFLSNFGMVRVAWKCFATNWRNGYVYNYNCSSRWIRHEPLKWVIRDMFDWDKCVHNLCVDHLSYTIYYCLKHEWFLYSCVCNPISCMVYFCFVMCVNVNSEAHVALPFI
jgi:hypothetical protein